MKVTYQNTREDLLAFYHHYLKDLPEGRRDFRRFIFYFQLIPLFLAAWAAVRGDWVSGVIAYVVVVGIVLLVGRKATREQIARALVRRGLKRRETLEYHPQSLTLSSDGIRYESELTDGLRSWRGTTGIGKTTHHVFLHIEQASAFIVPARAFDSIDGFERFHSLACQYREEAMNRKGASGIHIRDPFVVPVTEEGKYYLYGTTDENCWGGPGTGFDVYCSSNLREWEGPLPAFRPGADFWATENFWAPEVHRWRGRYFMFASFKAPWVCRGTQILVADGPRGPFTPHSPGRVTPPLWECLDGTFFVDDGGNPWMVFCHEWVQVHDGEVCVMPLTPELDRPAGEPILLFRASDAPWVKKAPDQKDFVTDGPFAYRTAKGTLLLLWSSFGSQGYAIGVARSASGKITGPWLHDPQPLYGKDGGHGMLFRTFDGRLMLTIHTPNQTPNERPVFLPVREEDDRLVVE